MKGDSPAQTKSRTRRAFLLFLQVKHVNEMKQQIASKEFSSAENFRIDKNIKHENILMIQQTESSVKNILDIIY